MGDGACRMSPGDGLNRRDRRSPQGRMALVVSMSVCAVLACSSAPGAELWVQMGAHSASGAGVSDNVSDSYEPAITTDYDGNPIVCWQDWKTNDYEIYVKRWDGSAWVEMGVGSASGGGVSDNAGGSYGVAVAADADWQPIICWVDDSSGVAEIFVKRWNGSAWVEMGAGSASGTGISETDGASTAPAIVTDLAGAPVVCWQQDTGEGSQIYARHWDGAAWVELGTGSASGGGVSDSGGNCYRPAMTVSSNGRPRICWQDSSDGDTEIYVKRWNGSAWVEMGTGSASGGGISNNSAGSYRPAIAAGLTGKPIVCWDDGSDTDSEIYVKRWNGSVWVTVGTGSASGGGISDDSSGSYSPRIATDLSGNPIVCWHDWTAAGTNIYVKRFNGATWVQMGSQSASQTGISRTGNAWWPAVATDADGLPIVCWEEASGSNEQVYLKRYLEHDGNAVQVNTDPDEAAWTLTGPESFLHEGTGDEVLFDVPSGSHTVTWHDMPGYAVPESSPLTDYVSVDSATIFDGVYTVAVDTGVVEILTSPDDGTWTLTGPDEYLYEGAGDESVVDLAPGDYTVTWQELAGYEVPFNSPETKAVTGGGTTSFAGTSMRHTGSVRVYTDPDEGTWTLTGPGDYVYDGIGDEVVFIVPTGDCTVTWHSLTGYDAPANSPDTRAVTVDATTTFTGEYAPLPIQLRVTGIAWSDGSTTARVSYEASGPVAQFYYRLYQTQTGYTSTAENSASFTGLGQGYYMFVLTAKDANGDFAPLPCRAWFYNAPVGDEFQVYLSSYAINHDAITFSLEANRSVTNYYVRLYTTEDVYTRNTTGAVTYTGLPDGIQYFVATGKEADTGGFPPGGPARQFFYIVTDGFAPPLAPMW